MWRNVVDNSSRKSGYKLVGEVCYEKGKKVARWITRVPGRIGLMIIEMLLRNIVNDGKWACEEVSRVEWKEHIKLQCSDYLST